jgi:hypothetical protein
VARFDTTQLLRMMNLKGDLPAGRFTDQDLLDLAYDCLLSEMLPAIMIAREDYYVTSQDAAITANQASYLIPNRALFGKLRDVKVLKGAELCNLRHKDLEDIRTTAPGSPCAFYMVDDTVVLDPPPAQTQNTLRLYYFIRPSRLVTVAECAVITAISGTDVTVTIPVGWSNTNLFDIVRGRGRFDILGLDLTATSVSGSTISFANPVPSTVQVGDYVSLAEETCFPYLPPEFHVTLTQYGFASALASIGDPLASAASDKAQGLLAAAQSPIKTRVDGEPKRLGVRLL